MIVAHDADHRFASSSMAVDGGTRGAASSAREVKIRVDSVGKAFPRPGVAGETIDVLRDISFEVHEGEFLTIVGPSGCGKTTLLRIMSGLEHHTSGKLHIRQPDSGAPENAVVFQQQSIFPWLTVEENIAYGLRMRRVAKPVIRERTDEFLEKTGLGDFRHAYPAHLSGGMKQRVAIARAFAFDPDILFMDEPLAALDEQTKFVLQEELLRIWEASAKTVVYVTHSLDESLALSDRVLVMTSSQPGRLQSEYTVPFERPRHVLELRKEHEYGELITKIWDDIGAGGSARPRSPSDASAL